MKSASFTNLGNARALARCGRAGSKRFGRTLIAAPLPVVAGPTDAVAGQAPAPPSNVRLTVITPALSGLVIAGPISVNVGQTAQYTARATYSDSAQANLTAGPAWSSDTATVTQSGLLTALAAGIVTIRASVRRADHAVRGDGDGTGHSVFGDDHLRQSVGLGYECGHGEQSGPHDSARRGAREVRTRTDRPCASTSRQASTAKPSPSTRRLKRPTLS